MKKALIIADAPLQTLYYPTGYDIVVALDGAANWLAGRANPNVIIGDLDSATSETIKFYKDKGATIEKDIDQNCSDLDKGINYCDANNVTHIDIINALGGRMDHTLYNLRALKKYYDPSRPVVIYDATQKHLYCEDCTIDVCGSINDPIALMSMPTATVSSKGLKYDMDGFVMEIGGKEGSSNALLQPIARVEIKGGALLICNNDARLAFH